MKKILSVALVLVMVLALCPLVISADGAVTFDKCSGAFRNVGEIGEQVTYLDISISFRKPADHPETDLATVLPGLFANKSSYTWTLVIEDQTTTVSETKVFEPALLEKVSTGLKEEPTFRFPVCNYDSPFIPVKGHNYNVWLTISQEDTPLYQTQTAGVFAACNDDIIPPPVKEVSLSPYGDGWRNWDGGSNGLATQLELLITNTEDVSIADLMATNTEDYTWELAVALTGKVNDVKPLQIKPSSTENAASTKVGETGIIRFETCEVKDLLNRLVPLKGATYDVDLIIKKGGIAIYEAFSGGFYCPMVPVIYDSASGTVVERDNRTKDGYEQIELSQLNDGFLTVDGTDYYAPDWMAYKRGKDSLKSYLYIGLNKLFDSEILLAKLATGDYKLEVTLTDDEGNNGVTYPATIIGYDDGEGEFDLHYLSAYLDLDGFTSEVGKLYNAKLTVKEGEKVAYESTVCECLSYGYIAADKKTVAGDNSYDPFTSKKVIVAANNEATPIDGDDEALYLDMLLSKDEFDATAKDYTFKIYVRAADSVQMWKIIDPAACESTVGEGGQVVYRLNMTKLAKDWKKNFEYEVLVEMIKGGKAEAWGNMFVVCTPASYDIITAYNAAQEEEPPVNPGSGDSVIYLTVAAAIALCGMAVVIVKARKAK